MVVANVANTTTYIINLGVPSVLSLIPSCEVACFWYNTTNNGATVMLRIRFFLLRTYIYLVENRALHVSQVDDHF